MRRIVISTVFVVAIAASGIAVAAIATSPEPASAQESQDTESHARRGAGDRAEAFIRDALAGLVDSGDLSEGQVDLVVEALLDHLAVAKESMRERVRDKLPGHDGRLPGALGRPLESLADALGLELEELLQAFRNEQSIEELAESNGVPLDDIVEDLTQEAFDAIDEAVASGVIDRQQAEAAKERLSEAISSFVSGDGFPLFDRKGPGFRFFGPHEGEPSDTNGA